MSARQVFSLRETAVDIIEFVQLFMVRKTCLAVSNTAKDASVGRLSALLCYV